MDQEERSQGYQAYKTGRKDVLVATDVASKGLDFPNIQHVINYDMPDDVDEYVHRIGKILMHFIRNISLGHHSAANYCCMIILCRTQDELAEWGIWARPPASSIPRVMAT